jgi:plastocyanin
MVAWSPRNTIIVAVLLSALVGSVTGLSASYLARTSPAAQTRDFYLFGVDQSFNATLASGLKADYAYSSSFITVNKGDTLAVHFYNPTDQNHTFTLGSPYANDVFVAAHPTDASPIHNATITINANQAGIFSFHCRFHMPSMSGNIVVQG